MKKNQLLFKLVFLALAGLILYACSSPTSSDGGGTITPPIGPPGTYQVKVAEGNSLEGKVLSSHTWANPGEIVTITVKPREPYFTYTTGTLAVLKYEGGSYSPLQYTANPSEPLEFTFTMPANSDAYISCDFTLGTSYNDKYIFFDGQFADKNGDYGMALYPHDDCIQLWQTTDETYAVGDFGPAPNVPSDFGYEGNTCAIIIKLGGTSSTWAEMASVWDTGVTSADYELKFWARVEVGNVTIAAQVGTADFDVTPAGGIIQPPDVHNSLPETQISAGVGWKEYTVPLTPGYNTTFIGLIAKNASFSGAKVYFDNVRMVPTH